MRVRPGVPGRSTQRAGGQHADEVATVVGGGVDVGLRISCVLGEPAGRHPPIVVRGAFATIPPTASVRSITAGVLLTEM